MTNPDLKPSGAGNHPPRHFFWMGLGVVALLFVVTAALTWRKWPDILVDFGTQLYIPWRILHGAVLYRDLFYFAGGPFSQYFNALLFKMFGVSFSTLIAANLLLATAMIFVVYRHFLAASDVWTATLIGAGIIIVFSFSEFGPVGNFNYAAPYSHEVLHGLVLSIFAIASLCRWIKKGEAWTATVAGLCTGMVFLTKPDIFTALAIVLMAALVLFRLRQGPKNFATSLAALVFAGAIPPLFFFLLFLREENWSESLRSLVFGWLPLTQGTVTKNPFYLWCTGLDHPAAHLWKIITCFVAVVLVLAFYTLVLRWIKNAKFKSDALRYVVLLLLVSPLLAWAVTFDWLGCGWPLPLLCLSACVLIGWNYKRLEPAPVFPLLWSLFALAMLAKLGFFPRIWHYGFALAMPAFTDSIYLLFWLLPKLLEAKFGISSLPFRMIVGSVLLICYGNLFNLSSSVYKEKSQALGTGGDKIVTYNLNYKNTQAYYGALLWTEKYMPRNATMAAVPQGIMLNYLTRHANPTPCLYWDPNVMAVFGRANMTAAFERNPPDYIFIVEWKAADFNAGYFGSSPDFGRNLMQWIRGNYQIKVLFCDEPLKNGGFGIEILKRAVLTSPPPSTPRPAAQR